MRLCAVAPLVLLAASLAAAQASEADRAAGATESATRITDIAARPSTDGSSIEVTFASSDPRRDLIMFWGTAPMATAEDLLRSAAKAQLDAGTVRCAIPAAPGADWWFAVLDAELYKTGGVPLVPGENVTTRGVRLPDAAGDAPIGAALRLSDPLPSLLLDVAVATGARFDVGGLPAIPAAVAVSPATAEAIADLLRAAGTEPRPILKVDLLAGRSAVADQVLQRIANDTLASGDWPGAERELKAYLSLPRSAELRAAARYYLGQAYWFQGRARDAFFEFLACEDVLPRESRAWRDACLGELAAGG